MPDRPIVGDFRSSPTNAPRTSAPAPAPTPAPPAATVEPAPEEPAKEPEQELTPKEQYEKRLADAKIPRATANAVFDAVMSKGYYEEYVRVGKQRAVFRTRQHEDQLRVETALEVQRPTLVITQQSIVTRYNLAASLYEWKGEPIAHETDEDFDKALALVRKLPAPVYALLAQKIADFDYRMALIFSDGAAESF